MKVVICDLYDGFDIVIYEDDEMIQRWNFDQEDTRESMVRCSKLSVLKQNMKSLIEENNKHDRLYRND